MSDLNVSKYREFWIIHYPEKSIVRTVPFGSSALSEQAIHVIEYSALESLQRELDEIGLRYAKTVPQLVFERDQLREENYNLKNVELKLNAAIRERDTARLILSSCQNENTKLKELVKHFESKILEHRDAYAEDIFPDDKRSPCQTTAGRMGRHMCNVFMSYIEAAKKEAGL